MIVTDSKLANIKDNLTKMIIALNNINKEEDSNRRRSEDVYILKNQKEVDFNNLYIIRNSALEIFDGCNQMFL